MLLNFKLRNMKIKYLKYAIIITSIFIMGIINFACQKTIEIDIEASKIKLVLNANLNPDSSIVINLSKSRHILDNAVIQSIEDASIELYEDDILIGNLIHDKNGNYYTNYKPKFDKTYKIIAKHPKLETISAVTTIPNKISNFTISSSKSYDENGTEYHVFDIKFTDPKFENNYYMIKLRNKYKQEIWDPNLIQFDTLYVGADTTIVNITYGGYRYEYRTTSLYFNSNDINLENNTYLDNITFSDELFDGKSYSVKISLAQYYFNADTNMIYFDLYSLSPDFYKYIISLNKYNDANGNPFAEPVMVFSNVENGIGIFTSSNSISDSILVILNPFIYYE